MFNLFKKKTKAFPCPCCGAQESFENEDYAICRVCNWENDPVQLLNPDLEGGANKLSLNQARSKLKVDPHTSPKLPK